MAFADAGSLYGMPPAYVEMIVLAEQERKQLEAERSGTWVPGIHDDDDGDGGTRRDREPVAA